jgi:hypothetical protein
MSKASGLTRGDKRLNQRLGRLRAAVPRHNAIVAVDLGDHGLLRRRRPGAVTCALLAAIPGADIEQTVGRRQPPFELRPGAERS